jgi:hypothetical protein
MVNTKTMGHVFKHPKYYEELRKRVKEEASSSKQQAIDETVPHCDIEEATSDEPQAPSSSRYERQASSDEQQASSDKPQAASSKMSEPL